MGRLQRRLRWLILKLAGAVGTAIPFAVAGLAVAILIGMHQVIPSDSAAYNGLPGMVYYGSSIHPGFLFLILALRHLIYAIYHSLDKAEIALDAEVLCLGLGIGLCAGLMLGIRAVNPEKHGF